MKELIRTEYLIGKDNLEILKSKKILVFGIGGVGSYTIEALARAGIGEFLLVDGDTVSVSNINRQLIATHSTIGMPKVNVMKNRILDINPNIIVNTGEFFYSADCEDQIDFTHFDYIVDAIDQVSSKLLIISKAKELGIPVISSMGTGNKLHPERFEITDISKTSICPLAKVIRKELKVRGIKSLKVLYSKEEPFLKFKPANSRVPSSISFVPSCAGLMIAGEVIRDLINL